MLGHSRMVSLPQVNDCLERGWIIRDLLSWVYSGHLDAVLEDHGPYRSDLENVAAFGTSSGGHLALGLVRELRNP